MNSHKAFSKFVTPYPLSQLTSELLSSMSEGHVCLDLQHYIASDNAAEETLEYIENLLSHPERHENEWLGINTFDKPLILSNSKLYINRFFNYEKSIVKNIISLIENENFDKKVAELLTLKKTLPPRFWNYSDNPDWQWIACICGFINQFSIITGGPGTGKTSTVNRLLYMLLSSQPELTIKIAAPTGKAAARLKESQSKLKNAFESNGIEVNDTTINKLKNIPCTTIHTLLGYIPKSIHFKHHAHNPILADVIIIDESSMIDLQLFYKLLNAIDTTKTKLILLGDKNQLASVEMGNIFGELCDMVSDKLSISTAYANAIKEIFPEMNITSADSRRTILKDHIIELQKSYRFDDNKGIGKLSYAILTEKTDIIQEIWNHPPEELHVAPQLNWEYLLQHFEHKDSYIHETDLTLALKKINNFKILAAQNEGYYGILDINKKIEQELSKIGLLNINGKYYHNQLIIITKNQPELDIYNGDIGLIREVKNDDETILLAHFEDAEKVYKTCIPLEIKEFQTAFAMTIHKSQGSEFDHVAIILPERDIEHLLNKDLLYTAITRAKEKLSIFGELELIQQIAARQQKRISGLNTHF